MTENKKQLNLIKCAPIYIFDLDGTLADIRKRLDISNKGTSMDWAEFFNPNNIKLDVPKDDVIQMAYTCRRWAQVIIFSGRADTTRQKTIEWLGQHNVSYDAILMRPMDTDEFTNDALLKERWLHQLLIKVGGNMHHIKGVFDDRNQVVKMWRDKGLTCFQVAEGNF